MRRLLLLRHAKAERSAPSGRDHDRTLAMRGREDAATLGIYLHRHELSPALALVSTSQRTRETWDRVAAASTPQPRSLLDERIYDATAETILKAIGEQDETANLLLVVGHNPGLHELALLLVGSGDLEARQRLETDFPTSALAVIDCPGQEWSGLHPGCGRLDRFVTPRTLAAVTD